MKNLLEERFYAALQLTAKQPPHDRPIRRARNQFHAQLLNAANEGGKDKHWPTEPCRSYEIESYDWPSNAI